MTAVASVGVVGSGGIAPVHLWAWRRLGLDVVVYSTNADAYPLADRFGGIAVGSLSELIRRVDVVDVCSPTPSHPDIVAAATVAERQVVCEKPLALTASEARAMVDACAAAGVELYPAHVVRYEWEYVAAKGAVDSGEIGELTGLHLSRRSAAPRREWFADRSRSGGVIMDQMIHDIDYARWVAGDVVSVRARVVPGAVEAEQHASVELTHAGGAVSHLSGEWGGPELAFAASFSLTGTAGTITDAMFARPVTSPPEAARAGEILPPWQSDDSPYLAQAEEFLAAFNGGPSPRVTAGDGVAAVAIAEAANRSVASGEPEPVTDVR